MDESAARSQCTSRVRHFPIRARSARPRTASPAGRTLTDAALAAARSDNGRPFRPRRPAAAAAAYDAVMGAWPALPLSLEQERMWLFDQILEASVSYDAPIS